MIAQVVCVQMRAPPLIFVGSKRQSSEGIFPASTTNRPSGKHKRVTRGRPGSLGPLVLCFLQVAHRWVLSVVVTWMHCIEAVWTVVGPSIHVQHVWRLLICRDVVIWIHEVDSPLFSTANHLQQNILQGHMNYVDALNVRQDLPQTHGSVIALPSEKYSPKIINPWN